MSKKTGTCPTCGEVGLELNDKDHLPLHRPKGFEVGVCEDKGSPKPGSIKSYRDKTYSGYGFSEAREGVDRV